MRTLFLLGLVLGACKTDDKGETSTDSGGDHTGETGDTSESDPPATFEDFINTTEAATGDMSCYDGSAWVTETADAACLTTATIEAGETEDFASGSSVEGAIVEIWHGDSISGTADFTATADDAGVFTG